VDALSFLLLKMMVVFFVLEFFHMRQLVLDGFEKFKPAVEGHVL